MSVLVESLAIIVRRVTLEVMWPGGAEAYLAAALSADSHALLACTDEKLAAVSFASLEDRQAWLDRLDNLGIVDVDNKRCIDVVCLDESSGPTVACDWIECRRHPDGFTYAWLAGTDAGEVVAPAARPRRDRVERTGEHDDAQRMIQLATDDGLDYWLDLATGKQIVTVSPRSAADTSPPVPPDCAPLMPIIRSAMHSIDWTPEHLDETTAFLRVRGNRFLFTLGVWVDDAARTIACYGLMPAKVDAERRLIVAEAIVRINQGLRMGSFDLDFDDGEMRYRVGCDVEGGMLTEQMALSMLGAVAASIDRYGPALMQVTFGEVSPEEAARRALGAD